MTNKITNRTHHTRPYETAYDHTRPHETTYDQQLQMHTNERLRLEE